MDWQQFRTHFPVTGRWAFLDHAAVAAPPRDCADAVAEYARDLSENGIAVVGKWFDRVQQVRHRAATLLNADPLDVCFLNSTTHGIGIVAEGFPWQPGDNLITAAEEYPSNQYPWMNLRDRGVEVRAVPSRGNRVAIDDLRNAMDSRTRLLAISSVEFSSGYRNDLVSLGELCRQRDIFFFVDAIQSLGIFPMDVQHLPVDALAADSHKWLLGPEGAGIGYIRRDWANRMRATGVGWNSVVQPLEFSTIDFRLKPHAGKWEGGTLNIAGIVGMGESLRLLLDAGIGAIGERILELTERVCEVARKRGCEIFSSRDSGEASGIVSLLTPGRDPKAVMAKCRDAGIIVNVRGGRLRVSPHAYNTVDEIDRFGESL
jgi:cysteine desulfurase / selenocysteine lyase